MIPLLRTITMLLAAVLSPAPAAGTLLLDPPNWVELADGVRILRCAEVIGDLIPEPGYCEYQRNQSGTWDRARARGTHHISFDGLPILIYSDARKAWP